MIQPNELGQPIRPKFPLRIPEKFFDELGVPIPEKQGILFGQNLKTQAEFIAGTITIFEDERLNKVIRDILSPWIDIMESLMGQDATHLSEDDYKILLWTKEPVIQKDPPRENDVLAILEEIKELSQNLLSEAFKSGETYGTDGIEMLEIIVQDNAKRIDQFKEGLAGENGLRAKFERAYNHERGQNEQGLALHLLVRKRCHLKK